MEQEGRPTEDVLQFIHDLRLFHLFVPNELEGRMTTLPQAVRIFQECSRVDGSSFGWLVTIGAGEWVLCTLHESGKLPPCICKA